MNRALLEEGILSWWTDVPAFLPPLPEEYRPVPSSGEASVILSPYRRDFAPRQVQLVPRCVAAGMGCRRGTDADTLRRVLFLALEAEGLLAESLAEIRTVEEKRDEPGLAALAGKLGIPLVVVDREELLSLDGDFTPSAASRHLGLPGVAEPCAASAGRLLGRRTASCGVTAAFSLLSRREGGKLTVLGTGPGDGKYLTLEGRQALGEADAVVGYRLYAELLPLPGSSGRPWRPTPWGRRRSGWSGPSPSPKRGTGGPPLRGRPGALRPRSPRPPHGPGARPRVGGPGGYRGPGRRPDDRAPYVNGLVLLSLSDYLQPWENVRQALEGAARSGLTAALYNPVKRDLEKKLAAVRRSSAPQGTGRSASSGTPEGPAPRPEGFPWKTCRRTAWTCAPSCFFPGRRWSAWETSCWTAGATGPSGPGNGGRTHEKPALPLPGLHGRLHRRAGRGEKGMAVPPGAQGGRADFEAVPVATCNRTEIYLRLPPGGAVPEEILHPLARTFSAEEAVLHLLRVLLGLESMACGESSIVGQVRESYGGAGDLCGPWLHRLFQGCLRMAKLLRTCYHPGREPSVPRLMAEKLRDHPSFPSVSSLVVGAGEMGEETAGSSPGSPFPWR